MQQNLFGQKAAPKIHSLTILKAGKKTLTANQINFNKLTLKIEKLQKEIEKKQIKFDYAIKLYATEFCPAQANLGIQVKKLILVLWDIYKNEGLSKANKIALKEIIHYHIDGFFEKMESDDDVDIKKIYAALEGISYERLLEQEKEMKQEGMQDMLDSYDLDIDVNDIDINDPEDLAKKIFEASQKQQEAYDERKNKKSAKQKPKTAKQIAYEKNQQAIDELKSKNISTIYKQLAKLFHPDLEQDIDRKAEKEILMKELTAAYDAKNLHALLLLELKFIHKENEHLETLSEEKLGVYLQILKEQVVDLEYQKKYVFAQPQYNAISQKFGNSINQNPDEQIKAFALNAKQHAESLKGEVKDLLTDHKLQVVKQMVKQWKQMQKHNEEEDLFRMLFED